MAIKKYSIHALKLLGASPLTLQQITQRTINPKSNVIYNAGAGQYAPSFAAVAGVEPEATGDTTDLAAFFTVVSPIVGLGIGSGLTYTGLELYHEGKADLGGRVASLLSCKHTSSKAFLVPRSVTCENGGEARISFLLMLLSADGTTAPLAFTDLVTPPSVVAAEKFTLGPVKVNGSTLNGVTGVTIDFGLTVAAGMEAGETYPKFATIEKLEPKIMVRCSDVSQDATFTPAGTALSSGAVVYFRKFQTSSIVYANGSAQHVSFTVPNNQGIIFPGNTSGSGSADESQEFDIRPLAGASAILAVATGQTIS
jgi:hypothetical protein